MKSIILSLYFLLYFNIQSETKYALTTFQETPKIKALDVLRAKCNVCHVKKKKQDVFTFENMDSLAEIINKQVFIKEKMPKGKKNRLTKDEYQALQDWLNNILNE